MAQKTDSQLITELTDGELLTGAKFEDLINSKINKDNIVNNDTSGGTGVPASAEIVKTHGSEIDVLQTQVSRYNHIINGDFRFWQRGVGYGSTGTYIYTADRWMYAENFIGGGNGVSRQPFTIGQTDVPNNPTYYLQYGIGTAGTATSEQSCLKQKIEDVTKLAGKTVTLSFWAKADISRPISIVFEQFFGTGGSPSSFVYTVPTNNKITLTTSWTQYSFTVTLPSVSGKTLGTNNNDCLEVWFWMDAGSDYDVITDSLGHQTGTFDYAQVQLTESSIILPWQDRSETEELALCQRYCEKSYDVDTPPGTVTGQDRGAWGIRQPLNVAAGVSRHQIYYKVTKRYTLGPTTLNIDVHTGSGGYVTNFSGGTSSIACVTQWQGSSGMNIEFAPTGGEAYVAGHWIVDYEIYD